MNKKILSALMLMAIVGFGTGTMFSISADTNVADTSDNIKYTTAVTKTVYKLDSNGEYQIAEQDTTHNLITTVGKQAIKSFLRGNSLQTANISAIAISNSTAPAVGNTALADSALMTGCGLQNVTAVNNAINQTAWDLSWQWTNTCTNQIVNTTGIFNATATGLVEANSVMIAGATLTSSTLQPTDKIQVNYTLNIA